jgi:hypothetical protein
VSARKAPARAAAKRSARSTRAGASKRATGRASKNGARRTTKPAAKAARKGSKKVTAKTPTKNGLTVLRPVGLSDDGQAVVLARRAGSKGTFKIAIDDSLVAQLIAARDRLESSAPAPAPAPARVAAHAAESKLTIKEIQALLREGRPVEAVARKAGVDPTWVERFEGPIVWERDGMARRAQRSTIVRSRRGPSELSLGESVVANLRRRRVAATDDQVEAGWDSVKETRTGTWRIRFTFTSRGRARVAEWRFDPETSDVTALNELANELGWVEPKRRRRSSSR